MSGSSPRARHRSDHLAVAGGAVAAALGGLAIVGWAFGLTVLTDLGSRRIPMAPSTALLFVLYGFSLAAAAPPAGDRARRAAVVVGTVGGAIAATLLVFGLLGIRSHAEHLGFEIGGERSGFPVGYMSPLTAAGFLLASISLLATCVAEEARGWRRRLASLAAALLVAGGGIFVMAYSAGEPLFYGGTFIPPAATTSAAFIALGTGSYFLSRPRERRQGERVRLAAHGEAALVGLFLLLAAGIVLAGASWFRGQESRFREQMRRQISAVAEMKAAEISSWRAERLADGQELQGNPAFLRLARQAVGGEPPIGVTGELEGWLERIRRSHGYEDVQLLAPDGSPRVRTPPTAAPVCAEVRIRLPEVLASGEAVLTDLHRDGPGGAPRMGVLVPIREVGLRGAIGVVALRIDPNQFLYPYLALWPLPSSSAETLLVRREGSFALYLNAPRFRPGSALGLRVPLSRRDVPAVRAAQGEDVSMTGTDYRGVAVLAATRVVPGSGWGLVARMDVAEAFAPLRERLWLTVFLMACLVVVVGAGVEGVWRRQLSRLESARRRAEMERAWLRDVIERSLNEIYVFDPETLRFRFANRGAVRNLGFSTEELLERTPLDIKPEFDEASFRNVLRDVAAMRGEVHRFETTHRRKDGTDYPVEVHLQCVETGQGDVFLAVVNDVTERRIAEARIRRLNRVYAVLSNVNEAIVRIREPGALCLEACRIAVEDGGFRGAWLGLRDAGASGIRLVARASAAAAVPGRESREPGEPPYSDLALEAIRTGRRTEAGPSAEWSRSSMPGTALGPFEVRAVAALPLFVEGEAAGALVLLADRDGFFDEEEVRLLDEMAMDIGFALETGRRDAARREAEAGLAQSEKRFRIAARLSSDFSYSYVRTKDSEYVVDWITDAFYSISGFVEADLRERGSWMFVVHPEDREEAMEPLGRLKAGEKDFRQFRIVTRDGAVRWLANRMECEADPSVLGGLRVYGAVRDVTRAREVEQEIRQLNAELEARVAERTRELADANRELETFAYSVSHDLKAPLRAIDGYSQILLDEHAGALNDEGRGYLGRLRSGAQRMAHLVEALLAYSRVDRRALTTEEVDVAAVVRSVLVEMQEEVLYRGAEVTVEVGALSVRADREGLAIVLRNLIGNALKYTQGARPPRIEVGGRAGEGLRRLWVRDNGIGFDMTYHDRIFEIFQRLQRVEDFAGTGIGLALVKKAVERMKGRVWAESAPGAGATFFVELPG